MVILGLVLLAAAVVAAVELILANRAPVTVHLWHEAWRLDAYGLAIGGAIILFAAILGLMFIKGGLRRGRRVRRERRELARENERLAARAASADAVDGAPVTSRETPTLVDERGTAAVPAGGSHAVGGPATEVRRVDAPAGETPYGQPGTDTYAGAHDRSTR